MRQQVARQAEEQARAGGGRGVGAAVRLPGRGQPRPGQLARLRGHAARPGAAGRARPGRPEPGQPGRRRATRRPHGRLRWPAATVAPRTARAPAALAGGARSPPSSAAGRQQAVPALDPPRRAVDAGAGPDFAVALGADPAAGGARPDARGADAGLRPVGPDASRPTTSPWPSRSPAGPASPWTTPCWSATSRRTTGARTSSWRCWPTSCATRSPRSATPCRSCELCGIEHPTLDWARDVIDRQVQPPGPAGGRPARRVADHARQDPAADGAGRRGRPWSPPPSRRAGR